MDASPVFRVQQLTPILMVEEIESSLFFWCEVLGFEKALEVAEGDRLAFVALERDGFRVMVQSRESAWKEDPRLSTALFQGPSVLYLEVDDLSRIEASLDGVEVLIPKRETPHGATELFLRGPGGHVVGLSQRAD